MAFEHTDHIDADAFSHRLRCLQNDLADESAETRQSLIARELTHATANMTSSQTQAFLNRLRTKFPVLEAAPPVTVASAPSAPPPEMNHAPSRPMGPGEMASSLADLWQTMDDDQREAIRVHFSEAGMFEREFAASDRRPAAPVLSDSVTDEIISFAMQIDRVVWKAWGEVCRGKTSSLSAKRREGSKYDGNLPRLLNAYRNGEPLEPELVKDGLNELQRLIAALIGAIPSASRNFAQEHVRKFDPMKLEMLARSKSGLLGFGGGKDAACWQKYRELSTEDMTERKIEDAILDQVAKYVVEFLNV